MTTTSDVVRAALQVIGKAPGAAMVSSFFLMYACPNIATGTRAPCVFRLRAGDRSLPEELAAIAVALPHPAGR